MTAARTLKGKVTARLGATFRRPQKSRCGLSSSVQTITLCLTLLAMASPVSSANGQDKEEVVLSVEQVYAAVLPRTKALVVAAKGTVPSTNWDGGRLVGYVYIRPPDDGVWDFEFVATYRGDVSLPVLTPILGVGRVRNPPSWLRGVRIHSGTNSVTYLLRR